MRRDVRKRKNNKTEILKTETVQTEKKTQRY